jgi:RNA polymerase sigma factor (sigma-70 family)
MISEPSVRLHRIRECLADLAGGRSGARDELMAVVLPLMTDMAHGMLSRFPKVQRWDETGDVVQSAALRLYRSLAAVHPASERDFLNFAAVHIRRELLDLARKYTGRESFAAHHETNVIRGVDGNQSKIDCAADERGDDPDLDRWARMHEAAAELPQEQHEVFHLRMYAGLSPSDIADALDCSTKTVHRRWAAATKFIENRVNDRQK